MSLKFTRLDLGSFFLSREIAAFLVALFFSGRTLWAVVSQTAVESALSVHVTRSGDIAAQNNITRCVIIVMTSR